MPKIIYNPVSKQKLQLYPNPGEDTIVDTKANILAMTPTSGLVAYATDTDELLIGDGTTWSEHVHAQYLQTTTAETTYVKLDASNGPLVGTLVISNFGATIQTSSGGPNETPPLKFSPDGNTPINIYQRSTILTIGTSSGTTNRILGLTLSSASGNVLMYGAAATISPLDTSGSPALGSTSARWALNASTINASGAITFQRTVSHIGTTNEIKQIVRAGTSQTANLTEYQNSAGTVLASVSATGMVTTDGRRKAVTTKTADYTATANDETIKFTSNATLTLPVSSGSGQHYLVRAVGCTVVIDGNGTDTINEELTQTLLAGDGVQIVDDGAGTWGVY